MIYHWDLDSLHRARKVKGRKIPYNKIKQLVDDVKTLMRKELDLDVKINLVQAGLNLNKILLK